MSCFRFALVSLLVVLGLAFEAQAEERILAYEVDIKVERSGDLIITEEITVNAEGRNIRRGIFRDWPRYYEDPETGGRLTYRYKIRSVSRNRSREEYTTEREGNAYRVRIGDPDRLLPKGVHTYKIQYSVKNAIRYHEETDELYWNAIGHYWQFPIEVATVAVYLPDGVLPETVDGYSGTLGTQGHDFEEELSSGLVRFLATRPYRAGEGLTVSISLRKGIIDPPSASDRTWLWWARNGALTALMASLLGLFAFLYRSFDRVGRDPQKPPVFPRYAPPKGYSPAAVHHVYHRHLSGHDALISSLMQLAVKGYLDINVDKAMFGKDVTRLMLRNMPSGKTDLPADTVRLAKGLFLHEGEQIVLDGEENKSFNTQYTLFRKSVTEKFGAPYFKWNMGYSLFGIVLSIGAILYAVIQPSLWTGWHTAGVVGLVLLNGVFMYLMPAPSRMGQKIRTEIEGFKLYLETAEKLQLNAVKVGGEAPPPMSEERYEAFLPYAIALGVERPWTKHFETLVPTAKDYNPGWTNMSAQGFRSLGSMNSAMTHSISSGVTSAMPSSSGSGAGGGGFSGGGGGGGGGGGW